MNGNLKGVSTVFWQIERNGEMRYEKVCFIGIK
jgi:hypothetical protein